MLKLAMHTILMTVQAVPPKKMLYNLGASAELIELRCIIFVGVHQGLSFVCVCRVARFCGMACLPTFAFTFDL